MDNAFCNKDPRGPLGHRGMPRRNVTSIEEFIGYAVQDILCAQELEHAELDMDTALDDLKKDYRSLVYNIDSGLIKQ